MSMLRWGLVAQPGRTFHLYYGLRNQDEHGFKRQLEQLAQLHPRFHLNVVYSRPQANDLPGRTLMWDGRDETLLDFAERHGVAVASGCRSGSCGSCETKLVSGAVHYARAPDHDVAAGYCLLCVGTPASALVLEA